MRLVRRFLLAALVAMVVCLAAALAYVAWPLPARMTAKSSGLRLEDRHGMVLRTTRTGEGNLQRWMTLAELDPDLIAAFLAVEDHRFYRHHGVDLRAVGRAIRDNLRRGRVTSGASTITMQLARLEFGTPRSLPGKFMQVLQALRLELHLEKSSILEQYLNRVPLGQGAVGAPAAAALYLGRSAADLSVGQAAMLAALARTPSGSNPLVSRSRAATRRSVGLRRLLQVGAITASDTLRASLEPVLASRPAGDFQAPHFTTRFLQEHPGAAGIRRTSLDLALQRGLESEVRHTVETLRGSGVRHAALVVLSNRTGEILAWVGSPDFWADTAGQVDMVVSPRQPGSALKPFLYGLAFDRGMTAASIIPDIARAYMTTAGPYRPRNYDRQFHGPVRAREALASSYNVPAIDLAERFSPAALLDVLHQAGFTSLQRSPAYYGLGLALGNGDVTLLELANGYRALANGGEWRPVSWLAEPADGHGRGDGRRVVSPAGAALVLDILQDPVARIPGFGLETPFDFPFPVAAKTGTSRHFTDNWAVGTSGNFTVAVWVGNFSGAPMDRVSGITGAGPLLRRAVLLTARYYDPGHLARPAEVGLVPATICSLSGLRAGARCPHQTEWFLPAALPGADCTWHRPDGVVLPAEFQEWAAGTRQALAIADPLPGEPEGFRITSPQEGDVYRVPPGIDARYATIPLRVTGVSGTSRVRWLVDGRPFTPNRWTLSPGKHTAVAQAGMHADTVRFEVKTR